MNKSIRRGWQNTILGEVLTFQRGFDITKKQLKPGKYDVIFSSGFGGKHNEYKVKAPGVVIGRKGTLGKVFFADSNFWATDTTLWVKDFHGNDEKFAYYFLHTMNLEQYDCGSANPTLNRNHIHSLPVSYPPLHTQNKIASILSAYDDLIENNTRRIKILESMAQTLYQEWFVKFRFPGHKQVKMVESELGLIPEGWEVKKLKNLTSVITKGTTPTTIKRQFQTNGINYLKVQSIDSDGFIIEQKLAKIDEETHGILKRSQLCEGDILFSIAGAIGRVVLVQCKVLPANTNQALAIIRPKDKDLGVFLYRNIQSDNFVNFSLGRVVQTAQANVSLSVLSSAPIIVPNQDLIMRFNKISQPIIKFIDSLQQKNINLRKTRDLLLPKLISGQIDVENLDIDTGELIMLLLPLDRYKTTKVS